MVTLINARLFGRGCIVHQEITRSILYQFGSYLLHLAIKRLKLMTIPAYTLERLYMYSLPFPLSSICTNEKATVTQKKFCLLTSFIS